MNKDEWHKLLFTMTCTGTNPEFQVKYQKKKKKHILNLKKVKRSGLISNVFVAKNFCEIFCGAHIKFSQKKNMNSDLN